MGAAPPGDQLARRCRLCGGARGLPVSQLSKAPPTEGWSGRGRAPGRSQYDAERSEALAAAADRLEDRRWPRPLQPLGMLAALARRDTLRGSVARTPVAPACSDDPPPPHRRLTVSIRRRLPSTGQGGRHAAILRRCRFCFAVGRRRLLPVEGLGPAREGPFGGAAPKAPPRRGGAPSAALRRRRTPEQRRFDRRPRQ